jgi:DNA-binding transcriptional LysR family regulator
MASFDERVLAGVTVLVAAVEHGSLTRAGTAVGLSASGVSRALDRLETRLGVRLLDRTTRTLRLTADGARLYKEAAPHLAAIEQAAAAATGAAEVPRGRVRASINALFAAHVLAPCLPRFHDRYPEVELEMVQHPEAGDLAAGGIDVAVRFGPQPASGLSALRLLETRVLTVAAPAYLERCGRPAHPRELSRHECLQFLDPQTGRPFAWEFRRGRKVLPVPTRGRCTLTSVEAMVAACAAGAGVAQVLALGVEGLLAGGALVELFPGWPDETFPLYLLRPSRRLAPARVEAFVRFCVEISQQRNSGG